ncbi:MAG: Macrolide-specific efflux protein MacA [Labilithrix sp.]|nr:Macrolide-specific efflux protein MacA [Labilithrix sp.]
MKKKLIGWLVTLVVLGGIGFGIWRYQKSHAAPDVVWKTAPVEKKKIAAKVTASGTLSATVTVTVGSQVSGRISKLFADFNTAVKKGQLLAKLDPQLFQAAAEQSNANYMAAKANVAKAVAQEKDADLVLARTKSLAEGSLASLSDLQTAATNVSVAKAATQAAEASLAQASAALHQAQVNLSYCDIYSPIDGTVISRAVDVGQTVAASMSAPVIFTIAEDLHTMQVHTSVAEGDVGRLLADMDASFTVDAFPGQVFKGKVSQIRNAATTVSNVVTYDAVIDLENKDLRLRPGMTASVTIIYAERDDALAVSNAALRFHPPPEVASAVASGSGAPGHGGDGGAPAGSASAGRERRARGAGGGSGGGGEGASERRSIYVMRNGRPEAIRIVAGLSDGTVTEVVKGELAVGDEVITDVVISGSKSASGGGGAPGGAPPGGAGGAPRMGRMF